VLRQLAWATCWVTVAGLPLATCGATLECVYADDTGDTTYDVVVGRGYAYVSSNGGVSIYDVRDPERPQLIADPGWARGAAFGLRLVDSILYVAAIDQGLLIVDVSDPAALAVLAQCGAGAVDVFVHRGIAYVSAMVRDLEVVDVSDPTASTPLSSLSWGNVDGVTGLGDHVYITDRARGIARLDVSNPARPVELGVLSNSLGAYRLEIRGDWLFAAMYVRGVRAYDVSRPHAPLLAFTFSHTGEAWDAGGEYPIMYVADLQEGVEVLDASAPYASGMIASDATLAPHALACESGYIHVADQDEGYVLLRLALDR